MRIINKFKNNLSNNKIRKYFFIGSFTFFLIKGLIWLIIFLVAGFSLIN